MITPATKRSRSYRINRVWKGETPKELDFGLGAEELQCVFLESHLDLSELLLAYTVNPARQGSISPGRHRKGQFRPKVVQHPPFASNKPTAGEGSVPPSHLCCLQLAFRGKQLLNPEGVASVPITASESLDFLLESRPKLGIYSIFLPTG